MPEEGGGGQRFWGTPGASGSFLTVHLLSLLLLWILQDMAVARSCLTLWVYYILMCLFSDPPMRGVFQLGLMQVS